MRSHQNSTVDADQLNITHQWPQRGQLRVKLTDIFDQLVTACGSNGFFEQLCYIKLHLVAPRQRTFLRGHHPIQNLLKAFVARMNLLAQSPADNILPVQ
jgi:hypothetical protein